MSSGGLPVGAEPGRSSACSRCLPAPARETKVWRTALALLLLVGGLGCMRDAALDQQVDRIGQLLLDAEASGALRCAPRQLAVARSHLEFAEMERAQGSSSSAERHLLIADQHARAARLLSPVEHCKNGPAAAADRSLR